MREIIEVKPLKDYQLLLTFDNQEKKIKDMKPYLRKGVFKKIKDKTVFEKVKISCGTICWEGDIDLCPDTLYETSSPVK